MFEVFTSATGTINKQFKTVEDAAKYCAKSLKRDAQIFRVGNPFTPVKWFFASR